MDAWEYATVKGRSNRVDQLVQTLNDAGAKGWEIISVASHESVIGANYSLLALAKRKIVPFGDPGDLAPGWKVDPSDRHQFRFWDGEAWTFHISNDGVEERDPPTQLTPAQRFQ